MTRSIFVVIVTTALFGMLAGYSIGFRAGVRVATIAYEVTFPRPPMTPGIFEDDASPVEGVEI